MLCASLMGLISAHVAWSKLDKLGLSPSLIFLPNHFNHLQKGKFTDLPQLHELPIKILCMFNK